MSYPPHGLTAEVLADYVPLDVDTPNIQVAVDAAVAYARRTAGWHIFPAVDDVLTVDGEGGPVLTLPTLKVNELEQITENGTVLPEGSYDWSATGDVYRRGRSWTTRWRGIVVELNHGYAPDEAGAADLVTALASAVAMTAVSPLGIPEVMGPFQFTGPAGNWVGEAATTLERFTLPWSA